jgi:hypothetical protein
MPILTYSKFLESNNSNLTNKYFLSPSNLHLEEIEDEFLRLKEVFGVNISIFPLKKLKEYNYFIALRNFNISDSKQTQELSRIQKHINIVSPETWFKETFIDKLTIKTYKKYPNSIFYMIDHEVYFELEKPYLFCRWEGFWSIFSMNFKMEREETQAFIKEAVEKDLKMEGVTPLKHFRPHWVSVEKDLKMEGVTPLKGVYPYIYGVEKDLKMEGVTPASTSVDIDN